MMRNALNFVIDLVTAGVMGGMLATGLLIRFVLPPGSGSRKVLWGLGRHDWGDVHFWLALAAAGVVLLHVALHWQWVCTMIVRLLPWKPNSSRSPLVRNVAGIATIIVIAGLFIGLVQIARQNVANVPSSGQAAGIAQREHGEGRAGELSGAAFEAESDQSLKGYMTLAEVAKQSGLSVRDVCVRLGVPADTPPDNRLGRLSKAYGFSMQEAREKLGQSAEHEG